MSIEFTAIPSTTHDQLEISLQSDERSVAFLQLFGTDQGEPTFPQT